MQCRTVISCLEQFAVSEQHVWAPSPAIGSRCAPPLRENAFTAAGELSSFTLTLDKPNRESWKRIHLRIWSYQQRNI